MAVVITGGEGDLAQAIAAQLSGEIYLPGRHELDVTNEENVEAYFKDKYVDLLVCNAGAIKDNLLVKMDETSWDNVIEVNLRGAFLTAKAAIKGMLRRRQGHVIFINSFSSFHPPVGQVNYAAAKAGLTGLTKSLAQEVGKRGVRVNQLCPGWLETKMTQSISDEKKQEVRKIHLLQEFNTKEAVAAFVKTLHTEMPFTSGQSFHLDSRIV